MTPITVDSHPCMDCGHEMEYYRQQHMGDKFSDVVTCKVTTCSMFSVTLTIESYNSLTPEQVASYRVMAASIRNAFGY